MKKKHLKDHADDESEVIFYGDHRAIVGCSQCATMSVYEVP
jgi:hypothetical protein